MAFAKFDPNNKPVTDFNNDWQKLPDGNYRQKLKDDCKPIEVDVEVLECTSYMKFQASDNSIYEHLPFRNTHGYFLFQARCAWSMYYVFHIFVRSQATIIKLLPVVKKQDWQSL